MTLLFCITICWVYIRRVIFLQCPIGHEIRTTVRIRRNFTQMCCAMCLVCPSSATHRTCQFWSHNEPINMPKTIESPAKCGESAVIQFLYAEGCNAAEIHRWMSNVYGETFMSDSKVQHWCRNLKQVVQMFTMQAVREGSECQLMMSGSGDSGVRVIQYKLLVINIYGRMLRKMKWRKILLSPVQNFCVEWFVSRNFKVSSLYQRTLQLAGD